jgi:hypothetical protein
MSIDLHTKISAPLDLYSLLPKVAANLQRLLNIPHPPSLWFDILSDGKRVPATTGQLVNRSSDFFQVSIEGEPETVGLLTDGQSLGVIMGAQRTKLEYSLGAAIAITVAEMTDGKIEDDWLYFGDEPECCANDLLARLRSQTASVTDANLHRSAAALMLGQDRRPAEEI